MGRTGLAHLHRAAPAASSATSKGSSIRFDGERGGDLPEAVWMDVWLMCIRRAQAL